MSYDLAFFAPAPGKSDSDFKDAYHQLCEAGAIEWNTTPSFDEFLHAVNEKYPREYSESEDTPWACEWTEGPGYCLLSMNGPKQKDANEFLGELLFRLGIVSYNPQSDVVFRGDEF